MSTKTNLNINLLHAAYPYDFVYRATFQEIAPVRRSVEASIPPTLKPKNEQNCHSSAQKLTLLARLMPIQFLLMTGDSFIRITGEVILMKFVYYPKSKRRIE